ncbi:MAG: NAD(P)-dependent oxidoreductase [Nonlabens sp.]
MKVLHIDENHPVLASMLEENGFVNHFDYTSGKLDITARIRDYQGLIIRSRFPIDAAFLDAAINLEFIGRVGAGLENIDLEHAAIKDIACYNAPEGNRNAVGEHALGMLLSLFNHLNTAHDQVKRGIWDREGNRGLELEKKTVGIIGYGNMGKSFARKLAGFDCRVVFHDIKKGLEDQFASQVSLTELQKQIDVLSLHTPQNPDTMGMVDSQFINGFHKQFFLINTARGKSVVTTDLLAALENGKILGAGLDVLEEEGSSFGLRFRESETSPLTQLLEKPNVLVTPHVAGWSIESKYKLAETIASKIINHHQPNL